MTEHRDIQQWELGEGPYFEPATNTLRFVDILKKQLHTVSLTEGLSSLKTTQFDERVTVTADIEGRDPQKAVVIGAKQGLAVLDRTTGKYEYLAKFDDANALRIRSNDGAVDPNGRFWLGTMTDFDLGPFQPEGTLYLFPHPPSPSPPTPFLTGLTIPNTVGFSPDARTLYFTHSSARTLLAFDYDPATGAATNQRTFYTHGGAGEPDGFRVDTHGNLWQAVYGEGVVLKISPAGEVVGVVRVGTRNCTCVEFVGGGRMVVTTAGDGDGEGEGESRRFGGGVFMVDVGAEGTGRWGFKL
ncbi:hypothetical protein BT67DRAFT_482837 [Trichocladium antarcticum]|uniref:SMP-30/Gluconolactonase/LRE-like region domain-containing protein n=1 Tax=Trichocladium antarcticum TaxID=1450529 RepID=A0AAN6ZGC7_9PEZI|nr:hypothetical protein BT67DRAFT_482837 [Trichocladium antarcticum]